MTQREFFRDFRSPQACHLDAAHDLNRSHPRRNRRARASAGVCLKTASSPQTGTTAAVHNVPHRHLKKNTTRPWAKTCARNQNGLILAGISCTRSRSPRSQTRRYCFYYYLYQFAGLCCKKKKRKKKRALMEPEVQIFLSVKQDCFVPFISQRSAS